MSAWSSLANSLAELKELFRGSEKFRNLYLADLAIQFGDGGLMVTFPLLILEKTQDITLTGVSFSLELLAFSLLSPFAGYVADRMKQRPVMVFATALRVVLMGLLWVAVAMGWPLWSMLSVSLAVGGAGAFFIPARSAYLVRILQGQALQKAIALEWTTAFLMRIVSPPLFGVLLTFVPASVGLGVDMGCFSLAILVLLSRPADSSDADAESAEIVSLADLAQFDGSSGRATTGSDWRAGWDFIARHHDLRKLLALDVVLCLAGMAAFASTVAYVQEVLHVNVQGYAWLLAVTGVAGAAGSLVAGQVARVPGFYPWIGLFLGLTLLAAPYAGSLAGAMGLWAIRGLCIGAFGVSISQLLAVAVPKDTMGRVNAAWGLGCYLACFAGSALTPLLLRIPGPAGAFQLYGAVILAAVATLYLVPTCYRFVSLIGKSLRVNNQVEGPDSGQSNPDLGELSGDLHPN